MLPFSPSSSKLLRLKWLLAAEAFQNALQRHVRALKFDPNQPRVPAGNSDGGQWTSSSGESATAARETVGVSGEFPSSSRSRSSPFTNVAARRVNEAACDKQYKDDGVICNLVRTPQCWKNAMERYAACLSGHQIPQLRF